MVTLWQGYVSQVNKLVGGLLLIQVRGKVCSRPLALLTRAQMETCDGTYLYGRFYPDCVSDEQSTAPFGPSSDPEKSAPWAFLLQLTCSRYKYSDMYGGHAVLLSVADGADRVFNITQRLKEDLWTDKYTRQVNVKYVMYNGIAGVFTFVDTVGLRAAVGVYDAEQRFIFSHSGILMQPHLTNIQSLDLEPYSTSA